MRKQMFSICLSLRIFLPMCVIDSKTTCHIIRCAGDYSFEFHRAHRDQVDLQTIKGDIEMVLSRRIRVLPFFFYRFPLLYCGSLDVYIIIQSNTITQMSLVNLDLYPLQMVQLKVCGGRDGKHAFAIIATIVWLVWKMDPPQKK